MENSLDLLILLHEEERMKLQNRIDQYIRESDFLFAHYHSVALNQTNYKLRTLRNMADKNYDEKEMKKRSISFLEKVSQTEDNVTMKEHYQEELFKERKELDRLNQRPDSKSPSLYADIVNEVLVKLVNNKIKKLRLILNKKESLFLRILYVNKSLKVILPNVKSLLKNRTLSIQAKSFMNLGFELSDNENRLTLILEGDKNEILDRLKIILSKIVFEILHFKELQNETYIEFTEK